MSLIRKAFRWLQWILSANACAGIRSIRWAFRIWRKWWLNATLRWTIPPCTRWVLRLAPLITQAARLYRRSASQKWHIDETYRAMTLSVPVIDSAGHTVDFLLTRQRDVKAACRFFKQAISLHPCPLMVTIDKSCGNCKAIGGFNAGFLRYKPITVRQN